MRGKPISLEMVRTVKTLNATEVVRETRRDALHRSIGGSRDGKYLLTTGSDLSSMVRAAIMPAFR